MRSITLRLTALWFVMLAAGASLVLGGMAATALATPVTSNLELWLRADAGVEKQCLEN